MPSRRFAKAENDRAAKDCDGRRIGPRPKPPQADDLFTMNSREIARHLPQDTNFYSKGLNGAR